MGFWIRMLCLQTQSKKLDPRCEKGIFVGYSKNSPAYLVYNPQTGNVSKHRLVKFIRKSSVEQQTQTDEDYLEIQSYRDRTQDSENSGDAPQSEESTENQVLDEKNGEYRYRQYRGVRT